MYKVIIAGSRNFNDYEKLSKVCDSLFKNKKAIEIVSGIAKGADKLGEVYAKENGYGIKKFPANWNKYGKKAGYLRNVEMSNYADICVVFMLKGGTKGSKHMINIAKDKGLKLKVIIYDEVKEISDKIKNNLDEMPKTIQYLGKDAIEEVEKGNKPHIILKIFNDE